jgi:hypothetical protein
MKNKKKDINSDIDVSEDEIKIEDEPKESEKSN